MKKKSYRLLKEQFVKKRVLKYLEKFGFGNPKEKITDLREWGVDIKVKKLRPRPIGWYYLVECKGDPSLKVKSPSGWRSSALNSALGQIISRMHTNRRALHGGYNYGVAFPYSFKDKVLKKIPYYVCNRLRLSIFLVNQNGEVEKYDHRKLKIIQKNNN
ncbi:MAG: hypothetical protein Q8Q46_00635 [Candidatus Giovannonibacteria bacterium]|nr:hypothetical protein [Candidatus Giovannonibacteria bacterium]